MRYAELTDRDLFIRSAQGDQQAFARLYQRYASRLTAYLYERCGRDRVRAQDLLQQVFLQLLEGPAFAQPSDGPPQLGPLLYTIAGNVVKNDHRQRRRSAQHLDVFSTRQYTDQVDVSAETDLPPLPKDVLQRGLDQLSDLHREVVELCYRDGLTQQEVATLLHCPIGTVKSRLHHGLRKLARSLRPQRYAS